MFLKKMQIRRRMSGRFGLFLCSPSVREKQKENRPRIDETLTSRAPGYIVSVREECG